MADKGVGEPDRGAQEPNWRSRFWRWVVRFRGILLALAAMFVAIWMATAEFGPFSGRPPPLDPEPSLWRLLLAEQPTLGFVRMGLIAGGLFLVGSVGAMVANNRWIVKLTTTGVETEKLDKAAKNIQDLANQVEKLTKERDEYREMVEIETDPPGVKFTT